MSSSSATWRPCTDLKQQESCPPMSVKKASGVYIYDSKGRKILDGISSWWCKSLGHHHPRLLSALVSQSEKFEHVITSDFSFDVLDTLSEKLKSLVPGAGKVFYGGDGASAVEISLKMSLHSHKNCGNTQRTLIATLENSYHGETCGALSVSSGQPFREIYQELCFESLILKNLPYVSGTDDPLWEDCSIVWPRIEQQLEPVKEKLSALIIEPLVQGAGGMKIYSKDFLKRLRRWTRENDIHLISDEIMTGLGRTGKMLAGDYASLDPDFVCLGKGLTSGWIPVSAVIASEKIVRSFKNGKEENPPFLHSHTYGGNALGAALALETLKIFQEDFSWESLRQRSDFLAHCAKELAQEFKGLTNTRRLGMMAAFDITDVQKISSLKAVAFEKGLLLRPLGKTIYWMPPLTITKEEINEMKNITSESLKEIFNTDRLHLTLGLATTNNPSNNLRREKNNFPLKQVRQTLASNTARIS